MNQQILKKFIDKFYGGIVPIIEDEEPNPGDLILINTDESGDRVDKAYRIRLYDDSYLRRIMSNVKANEDKSSFNFQYKSEIERSFDEMRAAKIPVERLTYNSLTYNGLCRDCIRNRSHITHDKNPECQTCVDGSAQITFAEYELMYKYNCSHMIARLVLRNKENNKDE